MEIIIERLKAFGHHGAIDEERLRGQTLLIDARIDIGDDPSSFGDDLSRTIDYSEVCDRIVAKVKETSFNLLETLADELIKELMAEYPTKRVRIEIRKTNAPMKSQAQTIGISLERVRNGNSIS